MEEQSRFQKLRIPVGCRSPTLEIPENYEGGAVSLKSHTMRSLRDPIRGLSSRTITSDHMWNINSRKTGKGAARRMTQIGAVIALSLSLASFFLGASALFAPADAADVAASGDVSPLLSRNARALKYVEATTW